MKKALESGSYPEYIGLEGPYLSSDPSCTDIVSYFESLWPNYLMELIVVETNRYAREHRKRASWVDVTKDELSTFLGIILVIGWHKLPRIRDMWSADPYCGIPEVQKHMSRSRFWEIWTSIHLVDNSKLSSGDGITAKVKPLLDVLADTFFRSYSPGQELSVDEAMVKYKGHVKRGRVSMPKKPIKKGFKIWCCCCCCCGYLCTFQVYEGRPINPATGKQMEEKGLVKRVVKDLVTPFSDLNHVVYCDNFFTSGPLVDELAQLKIFVAGTIQRRALGFPSSLKGVDVPQNKYVSQRVGDTCYFTFRDRKLVSFVSNAFPECMDGMVARIPPEGGCFRNQSVPPLLPAYNKYMGAVDTLSQIRKTYGYDRKSRRYWLRLFYQFFDYAVNNAHILYTHDCRQYKVVAMTQYDFRRCLANSLMKDTRGRKRPALQSTELEVR